MSYDIFESRCKAFFTVRNELDQHPTRRHMELTIST